MKEFSREEIQLLRENLEGILIDIADPGPGFAVKLIFKDYEATYPESLSLADALTFGLELGAMAGLQDEQIKTSCHAIHHNRGTDLQARKASDQLIRQGFMPVNN